MREPTFPVPTCAPNTFLCAPLHVPPLPACCPPPPMRVLQAMTAVCCADTNNEGPNRLKGNGTRGFPRGPAEQSLLRRPEKPASERWALPTSCARTGV